MRTRQLVRTLDGPSMVTTRKQKIGSIMNNEYLDQPILAKMMNDRQDKRIDEAANLASITDSELIATAGLVQVDIIEGEPRSEFIRRIVMRKYPDLMAPIVPTPTDEERALMERVKAMGRVPGLSRLLDGDGSITPAEAGDDEFAHMTRGASTEVELRPEYVAALIRDLYRASYRNSHDVRKILEQSARELETSGQKVDLPASESHKSSPEARTVVAAQRALADFMRGYGYSEAATQEAIDGMTQNGNKYFEDEALIDDGLKSTVRVMLKRFENAAMSGEPENVLDIVNQYRAVFVFETEELPNEHFQAADDMIRNDIPAPISAPPAPSDTLVMPVQKQYMISMGDVRPQPMPINGDMNNQNGRSA